MSTGKIMSIEELQKTQEAFIEASQTDEPVAIETQNESIVNGDSTKVGTNTKKDYEVTLYLPIRGKAPEGARIVMGGTSYEQKVKATQRFITPRIARKVRSYASVVAIAFTDFSEDGATQIFSVEDIMKVYEIFDDEVISACEKLVASVLGINEDTIQYITDTSLMEVCYEILKNNPSFFQED